MSKLKYNEAYNCHEHKILPGMTININWDSLRSKNSQLPPWKVSVFGNLIGRFQEFDEAENAAITYAKNFATSLKARTDEM